MLEDLQIVMTFWIFWVMLKNYRQTMSHLLSPTILRAWRSPAIIQLLSVVDFLQVDFLQHFHSFPTFVHFQHVFVIWFNAVNIVISTTVTSGLKPFELIEIEFSFWSRVAVSQHRRFTFLFPLPTTFLTFNIFHPLKTSSLVPLRGWCKDF